MQDSHQSPSEFFRNYPEAHYPSFPPLSRKTGTRHMRQWFKLERAYEMMEAYEEEHEDFDLVLKLRNRTNMGNSSARLVVVVVCWRENFQSIMHR